jgi:hypothetical protein
MGIVASFPRGKATGEADHVPPSGAEVKNVASNTPSSTYVETQYWISLSHERHTEVVFTPRKER